MPQFSPREAYLIGPDVTPLKDFAEYADDYVVRPPYQRHTVWSVKKKQALWDSLFRRYYVPKIILREVRLSDDDRRLEVVDGQQRISSVVEFLNNSFGLPRSLKTLRDDLPGKTYSELPTDIRRFVDTLKFDVDIVRGIDDPRNPEHQRIAAEIFWRLQQGETLTFMEVAHARLSSLPRNFLAKYADDIEFDFENYVPINVNPSKHAFFRIVERGNDRMQHLALLARLVLLERGDGIADIKDTEITTFIDEGQAQDGIGNYSYETSPEAQGTLRVMNEFVRVFETDPLVRQGEGVKELKVEYFIISIYLLLRHLMKHYVFRDEQRDWFRRFTLDFFQRWKAKDESDTDMLTFSANRQHSTNEIEARMRILRQVYFEWLAEQGHAMVTKDARRTFSEAERILIYRRDKGICADCIAEGKSEREAEVVWREYDADHVIPHAQGGATDVTNARVRCRVHNRRAGAAIAQT